MEVFERSVKHKNENLICKISYYTENNNTALFLEDEFGSVYGTATINIVKLSKGQAVINEEYYDSLLKAGVIDNFLSNVSYGYKQGYLCEINIDKFIDDEKDCI